MPNRAANRPAPSCWPRPIRTSSSHVVGSLTWKRSVLTAEDRKGFHGLDERRSIENLLPGCKIIHDLTLRAAAR